MRGTMAARGVRRGRAATRIRRRSSRTQRRRPSRPQAETGQRQRSSQRTPESTRSASTASAREAGEQRGTTLAGIERERVPAVGHRVRHAHRHHVADAEQDAEDRGREPERERQVRPTVRETRRDAWGPTASGTSTSMLARFLPMRSARGSLPAATVAHSAPPSRPNWLSVSPAAGSTATSPSNVVDAGRVGPG